VKLSKFGQKFSGRSGIVSLMDDLGSALNENPNMIFMGGGNPARIPAVEDMFAEKLKAIANDPEKRHSMLGIYQSPQGNKEFCDLLASYLANKFGWKITSRNIAVSNGSQAAFFSLYNMFAGEMADGSSRKIHLPLSPEYIGYKDAGLSEITFTATKPTIERLPDNMFKYHVDLEGLAVDGNTAAVCVSRPTNPTGNVLTDEEILAIDAIARDRDIPFIIDGAYGLPFPGIIFNDATPHWNDNTILVLSLSKLGLPGIRTGILIASEEVVEAYVNINTIVNLASSTVGPALGKEIFAGNQMDMMCQQHIQPFYKERARQTVKWFQEALEGLPFRIHQPEGAIFLWLWIEGLPISCQDLYERLKKRGVLVVPGQNFFIGIEDDWAHKHECLRVSYAQDEATVREGVRLIAEEVKAVHG
jgi:valine--pyruvate aminotransferase